MIALYLAGKLQSAIVRELKHLIVNSFFVYRIITIKNYTGDVAKCNRGAHKNTATYEMIQKVKKWLDRNP